ncbi:TIR domain-containing protein [Sorangium sp. So ce887]|uniref:toll/interleukin-1 receptor domain-containing protein n=1 Tax=Sorangium sp. So ce887 TaxID=3133324 RepID=UPI003F5ED148
MVESPLCVFISHAPADEAPRARLEAHLGLMKRQGLISMWHRGLIVAGQASAEETVARLRAAHLVVLLISARFLDSDDCYDKEMKLALARHKGGDARTIPVLIEACDWETAPFSELTVLPEGGKPIKSWRVQSEAWASVARGIRAAAIGHHGARPGSSSRGEGTEKFKGSTTRSVPWPIPPAASPPIPPAGRPRAAVLADSARERDGLECFAGAPPESGWPSEPGISAGPEILIGRDREILEVLENLGAGGAMISGRGGVGKTALALHLARELAPHYPGGLIRVDLLGEDGAPLLSDAAMARVISEVIAAHGAHGARRHVPEHPELVHRAYREVLEDTQRILLLDNARDSEQVEPLIPSSGCLLLVTSRQHFQLPGLFARRLDPLAPDDAIALVRILAPRLDEATAAALAGLCGCLPLALQLAAGTLAERRELDPHRYIERLRSARMRLEEVDAALACRIDAPS